jgi:hypothetical protein
MNTHLIAAILALMVVIVVLVEILLLGDHSWYNYLGVAFFAVVFILEVRTVLQKN